MSVTGLDEFDRFIVRARASAETAVRETVQAIRAAAKARVPVDTGATRDAIAGDVTVKGSLVEGRVYLGTVVHRGKAWYGRGSGAPNKGWENLGLWLEYGTVKMRARPFMIPAAEGQRAAFNDRLNAAMERATRA